MGRKPNPLVLEFFSRGPKLEDASNRYQYTCKACNAHFPKGRIESLAGHLAKQCGALSRDERDRALLQLRQVPEPTHRGGFGELVSGAGRGLGVGSGGAESAKSLSTAGKRLNGLEALAEASRRVEYPVSSSLQDENVIDPSLKEDEGYERLFGAERRVQNELATSIAFDSDQFLVSGLADPSLSSTFPVADHAVGVPTAAGGAESDLANIADSASRLQASLMEAEPSVSLENKDAHSPFDVYSEIQALRSPSTWPSKRTIVSRSPSSDTVARLERASTHLYGPSYEPNSQSMTGSSGEQHHRVQKIRGKFSDVRRKEVQEVRKRGACIRCRMLRKTCSGGDPCSTCSGIESARLWKTPCMRTRIASEFELYSTGLYGKLAQQEIDRAQGRDTSYAFTKFPGQIVATHVRDSEIYVSFGAVILDSPEDGHNFGISPLSATRSQLLLLDDSSIDSLAKLDKYVKVVGPYLHEEEPSQFMTVTIGLASSLCVERNDILLSQATQLWDLTTLLLDSASHWHIYTYDGPPSNIHLPSPPNHENLHALPPSASNHQHILTQLRALTEQKASTLSRRLLHDLERRLLAKSHSQSFATFLTALILLSCAERMCWLYHAWDRPQPLESWPLHYPPAYYVQQGATFAELIAMLLRMRGVPPKTSTRPESGFLGPIECGDAAVVRWFDEIRLSHTHIRERATAPFDAGDPRCWELRFAGKLFVA
ncbi:hypothetical protein MMC26_004052 [Xylographa opegraphella]|nr:hypothetical protein [Xylographa opegraphella]